MELLDWLAERVARYVIAPVMCRLGVHVWLSGRCSWCGAAHKELDT
jgi:hypothetical protein